MFEPEQLALINGSSALCSDNFYLLRSAPPKKKLISPASQRHSRTSSWVPQFGFLLFQRKESTYTGAICRRLGTPVVNVRLLHSEIWK